MSKSSSNTAILPIPPLVQPPSPRAQARGVSRAARISPQSLLRPPPPSLGRATLPTGLAPAQLTIPHPVLPRASRPRPPTFSDLFGANVNQGLIMGQMSAIANRSRMVNGVPTSLCDLGYCDVGLDDK